MPKALRHTLLAIAIGAMPLIGAAQTNSSSPASTTGAPSTPPTTNSMHGNTMRSADNSSAYGQAIAACDKKPMSERTACREAADSQFGKGGGETAGNTTGNSTAGGNPGTTGASSAAGTTGGNSGTGTSGTTGSSSGMGTSGTGTGNSGTSGTSGSSSGATGGTGGTGGTGAGGGTGGGGGAGTGK